MAKKLVCIRRFTELDPKFTQDPPQVNKIYTYSRHAKGFKDIIELEEFGPDFGFLESHFRPAEKLPKSLKKLGVPETLNVPKKVREYAVG